jgi:hypothetical protein
LVPGLANAKSIKVGHIQLYEMAINLITNALKFEKKNQQAK